MLGDAERRSQVSKLNRPRVVGQKSIYPRMGRAYLLAWSRKRSVSMSDIWNCVGVYPHPLNGRHLAAFLLEKKVQPIVESIWRYHEKEAKLQSHGVSTSNAG